MTIINLYGEGGRFRIHVENESDLYYRVMNAGVLKFRDHYYRYTGARMGATLAFEQVPLVDLSDQEPRP